MILLDISKARTRAQEIEAFAKRPENWYHPGKTAFVPGDRLEFVLLSGTVRAVFTWTQSEDGDVHRHLSISTMARGYPHPIVVWTLANMFGFTGVTADDQGIVHSPAGSWVYAPNDVERCVTIIEKIPKEKIAN